MEIATLCPCEALVQSKIVFLCFIVRVLHNSTPLYSPAIRNTQIEMTESYTIINQSTSTAISSCILKLIEAVITDMDWAVKKLKMFSLVLQKSIHLSQNGEEVSEFLVEDNLYLRAEAVVKVLSCFVLMRLKGK